MEYSKLAAEWNYDEGNVAGARVLLQMPLKAIKTTAGQCNWFHDTFADRELPRKAGDIAIAMLEHKLAYLKKLNF